jgi:hypothetical protein
MSTFKTDAIVFISNVIIAFLWSQRSVHHSFEGRDRHYHQYRSEYDRTNCDTSHNVYRCLQKGYYLLNRGTKRHNVTSHWYFPILYFMFLFTLCVFVSKQVQYNIKPENRPTLVSGFTFHKQTCMVYFGSLFSPLKMCLSEIKLQWGYLDFHCFYVYVSVILVIF